MNLKAATITLALVTLASLTQANATTGSEPPATSEEVSQSESFLPFGTLLPINAGPTSIETPMHGLISETIWYNGKLAIPAGTNIQTVASRSTTHKQSGFAREWMLAFENGQELPLSGVMLNYLASNTKPVTLFYITQTVAL